MSPNKKKESKKSKGKQGHSLPASPSKLGFRDAKKGKMDSAGAKIPCTISIDDCDDEVVGVKVEQEESVEQERKDKVVEELKEQLIEQKKESAEIKEKLDRVLLERSGVGGGVLDMNAVHSGMPTHQHNLVQVPYGPMGTMNPYGGSHFAVTHPHQVYPPQYPSHQAMPPMYSPTQTQHDWNPFGQNGSRAGNHDEDDDEKSGGGYSLNFSCVVS